MELISYWCAVHHAPRCHLMMKLLSGCSLRKIKQKLQVILGYQNSLLTFKITIETKDCEKNNKN